MKKYTLDKTQTWQRGSHTLYKIRYTEEFKAHIKETFNINLEGGWLESEDNLSQEGDCYVADNAAAYDGARIIDDAWFDEDATVRGSEFVYEGGYYAGDYDYVVDGIPQVEYDYDADVTYIPASYYDEQELPYFHRNDPSPEERERISREEEKFRREFDWDSLCAGAPEYDPDLDFFDGDLVDDIEEDSQG